MANICLYKILVKGPRRACYALIDMMPLYSWEKEVLREEGSEEAFELVFLGACKWSVKAYTTWNDNLKAFSAAEIEKIQDGDYWDVPVAQKALILGCEIFCNSKDIDDACWSEYEHYDKYGKQVFDECPKELHIKRGREYDQGYVDCGSGLSCSLKKVPTCKVRFEGGTYWYNGNYKIGDVVNVEGAMAGKLGVVVDNSEASEGNGLYNITKHLGNVSGFVTEDIEAIWSKYKPKDRKPYMVSLGLPETTTKKKFVTVMEFRWVKFALENPNWDEFIKSINS